MSSKKGGLDRVPLLDEENVRQDAFIALSSDESEDDLLLLERLDPRGGHDIQYKKGKPGDSKSSRNRWLLIMLVVGIVGIVIINIFFVVPKFKNWAEGSKQNPSDERAPQAGAGDFEQEGDQIKKPERLDVILSDNWECYVCLFGEDVDGEFYDEAKLQKMTKAVEDPNNDEKCITECEVMRVKASNVEEQFNNPWKKESSEEYDNNYEADENINVSNENDNKDLNNEIHQNNAGSDTLEDGAIENKDENDNDMNEINDDEYDDYNVDGWPGEHKDDKGEGIKESYFSSTPVTGGGTKEPARGSQEKGDTGKADEDQSADFDPYKSYYDKYDYHVYSNDDDNEGNDKSHNEADDNSVQEEDPSSDSSMTTSIQMDANGGNYDTNEHMSGSGPELDIPAETTTLMSILRKSTTIKLQRLTTGKTSTNDETKLMDGVTELSSTTSQRDSTTYRTPAIKLPIRTANVNLPTTTDIPIGASSTVLPVVDDSSSTPKNNLNILTTTLKEGMMDSAHTQITSSNTPSNMKNLHPFGNPLFHVTEPPQRNEAETSGDEVSQLKSSTYIPSVSNTASLAKSTENVMEHTTVSNVDTNQVNNNQNTISSFNTVNNSIDEKHVNRLPSNNLTYSGVNTSTEHLVTVSKISSRPYGKLPSEMSSTSNPKLPDKKSNFSTEVIGEFYKNALQSPVKSGANSSEKVIQTINQPILPASKNNYTVTEHPGKTNPVQTPITGSRRLPMNESSHMTDIDLTKLHSSVNINAKEQPSSNLNPEQPTDIADQVEPLDNLNPMSPTSIAHPVQSSSASNTEHFSTVIPVSASNNLTSERPSDIIDPELAEQPASKVNPEQPSGLVNPAQPASNVNPKQPSPIVNSEQPASIENPEQLLDIMNPEQPASNVNTEQPSAIINSEQQASNVNPEQPLDIMNPGQSASNVNTEQPYNVINSENSASNVNREQPLDITNPEQPASNVNPEPPSGVKNPEQPLDIMNPEQPTNNVNPEQPLDIINPEKPASNVNPEQPLDMMNPGQSSSNVNPESPSNMINPEQPASSVNPEQPLEIMNPEQSASNVNTESPSNVINPEQPASNINPEQSLDMNPEQPANNVNPEQPSDVINPEKSGNNVNPEQPLDIMNTEQHGSNVNPEQSLDMNPEQPANNVNPEQPSDVINPEQSGNNVNPEQPLDIINPKQPASNVNPEQPSKVINPEQPASNVNPEQPSNVINPAQPASNVNPEQPSDVINPEQSGNNVNPEQPLDIINPEQPASNVNPEQPSKVINPEQPVSNINPEQPSDVINPEQSGNNVNPVQPLDIMNPEQSASNVNPEEPSDVINTDQSASNVDSEQPASSRNPEQSNDKSPSNK